MLPALFLTLAALAFTLFRLWACRAQLLDMARTLEETPAESSLRLTVRLESSAVRRLCCAVNRRLDEGRDLRLETLRGEQELFGMVLVVDCGLTEEGRTLAKLLVRQDRWVALCRQDEVAEYLAG